MTARKPTISIVIPARNEETYIAAALESAAAQHYPLELLECIVGDNGSTDDTALVAARFAGHHEELAVLVVPEPEPGVGRAKNAAAARARGDVLLFLDADSTMEPRLALDVAEQYAAGFQVGSIRVSADSHHPIDRGFFGLMELGKVLFGVRGQMMYCDRQLFLALGGFRPDLHLAEDLEFLRRVRGTLAEAGSPPVCHIRSSGIWTSPRRLHRQPMYLGMVTMFARWVLAFAGIGRTRRY